jgi:hypothetical protein
MRDVASPSGGLKREKRFVFPIRASARWGWPEVVSAQFPWAPRIPRQRFSLFAEENGFGRHASHDSRFTADAYRARSQPRLADQAHHI